MKSEALDFIEALLEKVSRKTMEHGYPIDPWNHYEDEFLIMRLKEEAEEMSDAWTDDDRAEVMDELLDIAAFAIILWVKKRGES